MKLHKIFLGCAAAMALASCVSEDLSKGNTQEMGTLYLGVEQQRPLKTRADDYAVTDFPVTIYASDGTTIVKDNLNGNKPLSFANSSEIPESILLPIGTYYLEAHTPGDFTDVMTYPYYIGRLQQEIVKGDHVHATITCKMANTSIKIKYGDGFANEFDTWEVTFSDMKNHAINFDEKDGDEPPTIYWHLASGVELIHVHFEGHSKKLNKMIYADSDLTKNQVTETYDGLTQNFGGGDAIELTVEPAAMDKGYLTVQFTAHIFDSNAVEIPHTFNFRDNGSDGWQSGDGTEPDPQSGDDDEIPTDGSPYFICPALKTGVEVKLVYDEDEEGYIPTADTPNTVIEVHTPNGLKSLKVSISGGNDGFASATASMQDLEIIGSKDLGNIFAEQGAELPVVGQTEYSFPVYAFYPQIALFLETDPDKAHEFHMVAEDLNGKIKTGTLKVKVTVTE